VVVGILLIGHLWADFFLQSAKLAELKKQKFRYLLLHSGIYAGVFCVISYVFLAPAHATYVTLILAFTHFWIDFIKCKVDCKWNTSKDNFISFLCDQVIHIGVIFSVYYFFKLDDYLSHIGLQSVKTPEVRAGILYVLLFTVLTFPIAVFMKKLLAMLFENQTGTSNKNTKNKEVTPPEDPNVGSIIGMLERVIVAVLLLCNQYSAIGLVLTAKSIARFKQLEEKEFAEKYLIGTLASLLISLVMTLVVERLLLIQ